MPPNCILGAKVTLRNENTSKCTHTDCILAPTMLLGLVVQIFSDVDMFTIHKNILRSLGWHLQCENDQVNEKHQLLPELFSIKMVPTKMMMM